MESWYRPADHSCPHHPEPPQIMQKSTHDCTKSLIHGFRLRVRRQFGAARPTEQPRSGQSTATSPAGVHVSIVSPLVNDVRHIAAPSPIRSFETLICRLFRDHIGHGTSSQPRPLLIAQREPSPARSRVPDVKVALNSRSRRTRCPHVIGHRPGRLRPSYAPVAQIGLIAAILIVSPGFVFSARTVGTTIRHQSRRGDRGDPDRWRPARNHPQRSGRVAHGHRVGSPGSSPQPGLPRKSERHDPCGRSR